MNRIVIVGKDIDLVPVKESEKKKLWPGITSIFHIYSFSFNRQEMLFFKSREDISYTPLQYRKMAERIERILNLPSVFYFNNLPTYERDRLVGHGVYFIVGNKFVHLPTLLANRRLSNSVSGEKLLPSAQYILLLHLQSDSLNGSSLKDLERITPYKYATISKAVQQLNDKGLVERIKDGKSDSGIIFDSDLKNLWDKSQPYLTSPVKKVVYLPEVINYGKIGGISALSHYTMLAPENISTRVFTKFDSKLSLTYEDIQRVEIWKYPPIVKEDEYVDKLSLFLSLRDDKDPRVEKELEIMINKMLSGEVMPY